MACANPVSAAKLFVHLAPPRASFSLDFLLPRSTRAAAVATAASTRAFPSNTTTRVQSAYLENPSAQTVSGAGGGGGIWPKSPAARSLSQRAPGRRPPASAIAPYTSTRRYTQAVYNPQKDEDGNVMKLEITPRAAKRLSEIMQKDANPHLALRIQVESGGCHGFQYLMSLVTLPSTLPPSPAAAAEPAEHPGEGADSGVVREDDTIMTYSDDVPEEEAAHALSSAPKIILDQPSLDLLKGSKVDFTMELIGSQFKVTDNPMATSSCGCGTSFDLKDL